MRPLTAALVLLAQTAAAAPFADADAAFEAYRRGEDLAGRVTPTVASEAAQRAHNPRTTVELEGWVRVACQGGAAADLAAPLAGALSHTALPKADVLRLLERVPAEALGGWRAITAAARWRRCSVRSTGTSAPRRPH